METDDRQLERSHLSACRTDFTFGNDEFPRSLCPHFRMLVRPTFAIRTTEQFHSWAGPARSQRSSHHAIMGTEFNFTSDHCVGLRDVQFGPVQSNRLEQVSLIRQQINHIRPTGQSTGLTLSLVIIFFGLGDSCGDACGSAGKNLKPFCSRNMMLLCFIIWFSDSRSTVSSKSNFVRFL